MTLATIISEAQGLTRQSGGVTDAMYIAWLNRINRSYLRRDNWPETRKTNNILTSVANQAAYSLPSDFDRIMGRFVYWNVSAVTGGGYTSGVPVVFVNQGSPEDDDRMAGFANLGNSGFTPHAAYRGQSGTTQKLILAPYPTTAGTLLMYNYYAAATAFAATSESIPVPALGDTYTMALCKQIGLYLDNAELAQLYAAMERTEYHNAKATLLSN